MWLKFYKPAILSLIITVFFQIGIFYLIGIHPYYFNIFFIITFAFIILGIGLTYKSCAQNNKCKSKMAFQVFIIPPIFLFLGLVGLLFFNTNFYIREIFVILSGLAYFIIFSEIFSDFTNKAHDVVKFLIIFLLFDSVLELVHYYKLPLYFIFFLILACTILLTHHMFWRLLALKKIYSIIGVCIGAFLGIFAWISALYWPLASYFTLAIMVMSLYYVAWGMLHHHIEHNLTKEIAFDYILIGAFVFIMTFGLIFLKG